MAGEGNRGKAAFEALPLCAGLALLACALLCGLISCSAKPAAPPKNTPPGDLPQPPQSAQPKPTPDQAAPAKEHLKPAFSGESTGLKRTAIVPTLDTPAVAGKNVIYCSSFQVAWNRMKTDVVKSPILIRDAEEVARRLNEAQQSENDLDPASFYAAAGRANEVLPRIKREMAAKFPEVKPNRIEASPTDLVAYAFLSATVRFELPFLQNDQTFLFKEKDGSAIAVTSFGLRHQDVDSYMNTREQVGLLFADSVAQDGSAGCFALDLCRTSAPNQLILAKIPLKSSLAETLSDLDARIAQGRPDTLKEDAIMLIPDVLFDLEHHFSELEGRALLNPGLQGLFVKTAWQGLQFRLDRFGASVRSEAKIVFTAKVEPKRFIFNGPFLAVMKKRGAQHPFLVMWVENAELLCKP